MKEVSLSMLKRLSSEWSVIKTMHKIICNYLLCFYITHFLLLVAFNVLIFFIILIVDEDAVWKSVYEQFGGNVERLVCNEGHADSF